MKWMGLNTLREEFLSFFESKGHLRLGSFSLVPDGDPSLLLINSGMAPMKKYFTGELTPPRRRVTTCQKCIRTPDLERVGHTARHGTFFEMLGNFSFGDYFKREAIHFAWEFLTGRLEIPAELLWPSVYEKDDEAYSVWRDEIGVPEARIVRLGKEDNFWEHGSGPCGPCSEIYFDRGEKYGCGKPDCRPGCDCDRYMEIWNNVFSQFNNDGAGHYTDLKQKNIDTGMGLERLACVVQGVDNLFEVDTVRRILDTVCRVSGKRYGENGKDDVSIRVITDHMRGATFMICDGILPSNEGRGYVLRRLLRRAARCGRLLGVTEEFLPEVSEAVIAENAGAYPELAEKRGLIKKIIGVEEEAFSRTLDQGERMLDEMAGGAGSVLSGHDAFRLYDTFGFPLDITKDILAERGMTVDEAAFESEMAAQRERARAARKAADRDAWKRGDGAAAGLPATVFTGYTENGGEAVILRIIKDGEEAAAAYPGEEVAVALDRTPFYAESGGQVGDTGVITTADGKLRVLDTVKTAGGVFLHVCRVESGVVTPGAATAAIDADRRAALRRNHTAAHLLQAALRDILGTHVEQAGQFVSEEELRFDFTHFSALTDGELAKVEAWVNAAVLDALPVTTEELPLEEARRRGAMALFGEKYGERVRVVTVPGRSMELCGGTHVANTANIGLFLIRREGSVAAGVRRIEAYTGSAALREVSRQREILGEAAAALGAGSAAEVPKRAAALREELRAKERVISELSGKLTDGKVEELSAGAETVGATGDVRFVAREIPGADADTLRRLCDGLKEREPAQCAVLAARTPNGVTFAAVAGKDAVARGIHAGKLVSAAAAAAGGKGGGRPDFAMAGARDSGKIDAALAAAREYVAGVVEG